MVVWANPKRAEANFVSTKSVLVAQLRPNFARKDHSYTATGRKSSVSEKAPKAVQKTALFIVSRNDRS